MDLLEKWSKVDVSNTGRQCLIMKERCKYVSGVRNKASKFRK